MTARVRARAKVLAELRRKYRRYCFQAEALADLLTMAGRAMGQDERLAALEAFEHWNEEANNTEAQIERIEQEAAYGEV